MLVLFDYRTFWWALVGLGIGYCRGVKKVKESRERFNARWYEVHIVQCSHVHKCLSCVTVRDVQVIYLQCLDSNLTDVGNSKTSPYVYKNFQNGAPMHTCSPINNMF